MPAVIVFPSALEYWLLDKGVPRSFQYGFVRDYFDTREVLSADYHRQDLYRLPDFLNFSTPIHIGVPEHVNRNGVSSLVFHMLPPDLPQNSFVQLSEEIYVCSPELCFLMAANVLPIHELVYLGNELCSIYIRDQESPLGQRSKEPITTVDSIRSYLNMVKNVKGIKNALRAIQFVLNRSNSPMESKLAVLATLPLSLGGYGLTHPALNYHLSLSAEGCEYMGSESLCCDMVWQQEKVVLEYDSTLSHLGVEQHKRDKKRITSITLSGYKIMCITAEQVRNFNSIENTFLSLRKLLGIRSRHVSFDKYFDKRWSVVRSVMFQNRLEKQLRCEASYYSYTEL